MMDLDILDDETLFSFLRHLPLLLVTFVALVLALLFWRRHPRVSALAFAGAMLLLAESAFYVYWEFVFIPTAEPGDDGIVDALDMLMLWIIPFVQALGMALLVAAIFVGRGQAHGGAFFDDA